MPAGHFESGNTENQQILPIATKIMHTKFEIEIPKQTSYSPETMPPNSDTKRSNMAARLSFWKWHHRKLIFFYTQIKSGSDIESQTKVRVWKPKKEIWLPGSHFEVTLLKVNKLLSIHTGNILLKFIFKARIMLRVQKLKNSNMTARWPFWKWHHWNSTGFCIYTEVMCYWSLDLIFQVKVN